MNRQEEVGAVIRRYIDATYRADVECLRGLFHRDARMNGYLGSDLLIGTPEPFFADLASAPSMAANGDPFHAEITHLQVTGGIAEAVVYCTGFRGVATIEDHFHLVDDHGWKIICKTFTTI